MEALEPDQIIHLPYDFSDEYTGWLQVTDCGLDRVRLRVGWAFIAGWSFRPSDLAAVAQSVEYVTMFEDSPELNCARRELIDAIRQSRDAIAAGL